LKVLLKNANRTFGFTTLVWITTGVTGTAALAPTGVIELPFYQLLILSLVFSTPSFLVISPALWIQPPFPTKFSKFLYLISIAVLSCIAVIAFFLFVTRGYPLERDLILSLLTPYVISAIVIVPVAIHFFTKSNHENKN
jgi:hypothetical protein